MTKRSGIIVLLGLFAAVTAWFFLSGESAHESGAESRPTLASSQSDRPVVSGRNVDFTASSRPANRSRHGEIVYQGERYATAANVRGEFPRFYVDPDTSVAATAHFPNLAPGAVITLDAADGGRLNTRRIDLDDQQQVLFEFDLPRHDGAHRVTLRHGIETRTFEFWVGEEPPVVVRRD